MVKHEDENSSSSTDSSSSSFASSCKSEKLKCVTKKEALNLSKSTPASSSTLSSSLTPAEPGYSSNTNSLFKLNPTNNSFNSHSTGVAANMNNTQLQNLVKMRSSAASKSASNSNEHSFLGAAGVNSSHFKQTMNSMHLMSSSKHLEKDRDKAGISSNCSTSSSSSNSSFNNGNVNHTGEIVVVEETVRKREMRLLKNR